MEPDIKRILYATDLSPNSTHALRYANKLARQNNARLTILHAVEMPPPTTFALISSVVDHEEMKARREERVNYHIEQIRERLDRLCETECAYDPEMVSRVDNIEVRDGFAAEEILKEAEASNCDMIVMGTHGKGALENTFIGSVARRVMRRASKPVLVVPLPRAKKKAAKKTEAI
jgi:nucleotide-binding universal stress UspA family protein